MDTHGYMLEIDTATDFRWLVFNCLAKFNLLKNGKNFKFHVEQCKSLCSYMVDKLSPFIEYNGQYLGLDDVRSKSVQRAWKETYRAAKEAETYLKDCSSDGWLMECVILCNTGEAFALHMHDLAWSLLCLDLALLCPIQGWNDCSYSEKVCNRICDFFAEMSGLHLQQFGFKFQDYWHLLMACNQTAAKAWTSKQKNKIGVLQFMERKLLETIRNECKVESATGIPTRLQIPPKDLIVKGEPIGEGSFGEVYEGSWLGFKVAVKDIPIDARDLFDRETEVLANLQSPFIVQLIGTCIEGSHCYIVMELVSSSLDKLLVNSGGRAPLALPVAVDMMLQISRGMEYLHRQGIMHMDLKASNVLIEPSAVPEFREQGYGRVKLCDFGMASLRLSSFRCEDPKGTCYWRAPEAFPFPNEELLQEIDTLEEYTYKADVYSFAMTCYEILTGKQPFLGVHPKDLYRLIVQGRRPILQPTSCPAVLADYIVNCWETDPRRRPCFAQVSTFMRNMKLFILRMDDPRDWFAKSGDNYLPFLDSLVFVTYKEEAFDESPADEKMKSITRVLHIVPAEIKRRYNINVAEAMPSEKNAMPSEKLKQKIRYKRGGGNAFREIKWNTFREECNASEKSNAMPSEKNVMPSEKSNIMPLEKTNAMPLEELEKSNAAPSEKNVMPSENNVIPSENGMPSENNVIASENGMPSEKSNALPSENNVIPSEKSNAQKDHPTHVFLNMENYLDLGHLLQSTGQVLGKGSFGTTYRAESHGLHLVVKRSSEDTTYVGDKRYFERCLQVLRSLKHPNLVSLQAYHFSNEDRLLVYNYFLNGSLYSLLHAKIEIEIEPLKWERRIQIALDVAIGLAFLHKNGMVHGNVKSSNVLLDDDGNACLADSCLAGLVRNSNVAKTSSGYMAPEQYNS